MKTARACWSRDTGAAREIAYSEIEFGGMVHEISIRNRGDETIEVRAHGPNYAACKVLRPPETMEACCQS